MNHPLSFFRRISTVLGWIAGFIAIFAMVVSTILTVIEAERMNSAREGDASFQRSALGKRPFQALAAMIAGFQFADIARGGVAEAEATEIPNLIEARPTPDEEGAGQAAVANSSAGSAAAEAMLHEGGDMQLDKGRTAIVFIEFQREWLHSDGILRRRLIEDDADFRAAVDHARRILAVGRENGWRIVHAGLDMRNDPDYMLFNRGKGVAGLRGAIPKAGTWIGDGAEFVPPFVPGPEEYVVQGRSGASVLKNSTLDPYLRNAGVDTLVLLGFALHVCVESSLREAHDLGYNVIVPSDASGVFVPEQRTYFDQHVVHHFGEPIGTRQLLEKLGG